MVAILDPDSETTRRYLLNVTTRLIHRTDSEEPACRPRVSDTPSWSDSLQSLTEQGNYPCPVCMPKEGE